MLSIMMILISRVDMKFSLRLIQYCYTKITLICYAEIVEIFQNVFIHF